MLQLSPMLSNTLLSRHQWLELAKAPFGCLARQPGWASNNSGISLTMVGETGWTSDYHNLSPRTPPQQAARHPVNSRPSRIMDVSTTIPWLSLFSCSAPRHNGAGSLPSGEGSKLQQAST